MRVLLLEDDPRFGQLLRQHLLVAGYVVDLVTTVAAFCGLPTLDDYQLFILDLSLPDGDGLDVIQMCREARVQAPILVTTARVSIPDRVAGLDRGADDYLVKPLNVVELLARVRALLRRPPLMRSDVLTIGRLSLEMPTGPVLVDGVPVLVSPAERRLLALLMRRPGAVVAKSTIFNQVYDLDHATTPNAVDKMVSRLRKSLAQTQIGVDVRTVRGIGYALEQRS